MSVAKLEEALGDVNAALPLLREAGYVLDGVSVKLGLNPQIVADFAGGAVLSQERVDEILAEHSGRKLTTLLVKAVRHATTLQSKLTILGVRADGLSVEVGLVPQVTVKFSPVTHGARGKPGPSRGSPSDQRPTVGRCRRWVTRRCESPMARARRGASPSADSTHDDLLLMRARHTMEREQSSDLERARRSLQLENNGRTIEREVPVPAEELSAEEALEIAIEAYVYAYPLVLMDAARAASTNTATADGMRASAPMNQFSHAPAFPDARFTAVVRPNVDTLSSSLWFDVSKEPLVVSIPDSGGRYYLMPMLDLWSDVFASPGKRTTGTRPQRYAIVGPHWSGTLPDGVDAVRAPTSLGWITGRTQADGPSDYEGACAFQAGMRALPLSVFARANAPAAASVDSRIAPIAPASAQTVVNQVALMDGATLFARFAELTADNPPHANDHPQLQRMKRLGIVPGVPFVYEHLSHNTRVALDRATPFAQRKIRDHASRAARIANGWVIMSSPIGSYGTDFLKRALTAFLGLGTPPVEDAMSPTAFATADGVPFDSEAKYELRFPHTGLPPARAFWSLTMYDDQQQLADNPIGRYAIGDRDPLRYDSDGSLMLYIQRESPGRGVDSNWLPTPKEGAFTLTLRLYWPGATALDGRWAPPLVKRVADARRPPRHGYRA